MRYTSFTRDEIIEMDRRATARLAKVHGERMLPSVRRKLERSALRAQWNYDPLFIRVNYHLNGHVRCQEILEQVCWKHGIGYWDLVGTSRAHPVIAARQEAAYRLRHEKGLSYPQIGRRLGGRDHTTILWAVKQHIKRLEGA